MACWEPHHGRDSDLSLETSQSQRDKQTETQSCDDTVHVHSLLVCITNKQWPFYSAKQNIPNGALYLRWCNAWVLYVCMSSRINLNSLYFYKQSMCLIALLLQSL